MPPMAVQFISAIWSQKHITTESLVFGGAFFIHSFINISIDILTNIPSLEVTVDISVIMAHEYILLQ
jgi:hypothetical protein